MTTLKMQARLPPLVRNPITLVNVLVALLFFFTILGFIREAIPPIANNDLAAQAIWGVLTGLFMSALGITFLLRWHAWRKSLSFLVGPELLKGKWPRLVAACIVAGVGEEVYARGLPLILLQITGTPAPAICFALIGNAIWTASHLGHRKKEMATNPLNALKESAIHLLIIFLSGLVFAWLILTWKSLLPAMIAHTTSDFCFGLFYRKHAPRHRHKA